MTIEGKADDGRWLSVKEDSDHLGVTSDTIYRWVDERGMPAYRLGRFWKFKKVEVDEWVRDGGGDSRIAPSADISEVETQNEH